MALELFGFDTIIGGVSEGTPPIKHVSTQVDMIFTPYHRIASDFKKVVRTTVLISNYKIPDVIPLAVRDPRIGSSNKLFALPHEVLSNGH